VGRPPMGTTDGQSFFVAARGSVVVAVANEAVSNTARGARRGSVSAAPGTASRPIRRLGKYTSIHIAGGSVLAVIWQCQAVLNPSHYLSFCMSSPTGPRVGLRITFLRLFLLRVNMRSSRKRHETSTRRRSIAGREATVAAARLPQVRVARRSSSTSEWSSSARGGGGGARATRDRWFRTSSFEATSCHASPAWWDRCPRTIGR